MLKSECTPEQWEARLASIRARREKDPEAVRAYHRDYSARPEAKAKRQAKNRTEEKKAAERERYRRRKEEGKIRVVRTEEQKRERYLAAQKKYWTPEKYAEIQKRRKEREIAEPDRIARRKKYTSDYARKRNTNFTPEQYKAALEAQGGGCAICGSTYRLHADHDHKTGKPRGILCATCNQVEGMLNKIGIDPVDYGRLLKVYLSRPPLKY